MGFFNMIFGPSEEARCPHCGKNTGISESGDWQCKSCCNFFSYYIDGDGDTQLHKLELVRVHCTQCMNDFQMPSKGKWRCPKCGYAFEAGGWNILLSGVRTALESSKSAKASPLSAGPCKCCMCDAVNDFSDRWCYRCGRDRSYFVSVGVTSSSSKKSQEKSNCVDKSFERAKYLLNENRFAEAIESFHLALLNNLANADCYFGRGLAYVELEDWEKAISDFGLAIQCDFEDLGCCYFFRGVAHIGQENWEKAKDDLTNAIQYDFSPEPGFTFFLRGWAYYNQGEWKKAIDDYNKVITILPEESITYYRMAIAQEKAQRYPEALAYFKQYLEHENGTDQNLREDANNRIAELNNRSFDTPIVEVVEETIRVEAVKERATRFCEECGSAVSQTAKFCKECGFKLVV